MNWLIHKAHQMNFLPFHTEFLVMITILMVLSLTGKKYPKLKTRWFISSLTCRVNSSVASQKKKKRQNFTHVVE